MENQFKTGEFIVYDTYGICEIKEIKKMSLVQGSGLQTYYILIPVNSQSSTFYVPCSNEKLCSKMRRPMNAEQIRQLLSESRTAQFSWIENRQLRAERAREILKGGITPSLIALIRCLYERKTDLKKQGKSLSSTDDGILTTCEKLINEEFSFSLNIPCSCVPGYISGCMEG